MTTEQDLQNQGSPEPETPDESRTDVPGPAKESSEPSARADEEVVSETASNADNSGDPAIEAAADDDWDEAEAEEMDALMEEHLSNLKTVRKGEVRSGEIVAIDQDSVLINLDDKSEGVAPLKEFIDSEGNPTVKIGDPIQVQIMSRDPDTGQIGVSFKVAQRQIALQNMRDAMDEKKPVKGVVDRTVKSGVIVDCSGVESFMPASQIDLRRVENLEDWVGKEIEVLPLELKPGRGRCVVSRRQWLEMLRDRRRDELMQNKNIGDVVEGEVKNVLGFGAFVDLDGVEALIPREEVSWEKASAPIDSLRPGNRVQAKIIKMNPDTGKITLSRKQMTENPWESVRARYPTGSVVAGEVAGLTKFGAFVRLEEGLTGMIHASDLSWSSSPTRPEEVLNEGDTVQAVVLDIDTGRERMSLGLKQISDDPWVEAESKYPPNSKIKGKVTGLTKFGAFVQLEENIEGLIHISDLTWDKNTPQASDVLKEGEEVEAVVLKSDRKSRRISLGLKQLTPSPLEQFASQHKAGEAMEGKVVNIIDSGAFLELEPGIEGFLPVSHMSEERINKPEDFCKAGDTMTVKVTKLDVRNNRISLSRRQYLKDQERKEVANYMRSEDDAKGGLNLGELLQDISLPNKD